MEKIKFHQSYLQLIYLIIIVILFSFIIYTPTFIEGPFRITNKLIIEEEKIEGFLIGILFILSFIILGLYRKEGDRNKEQIQRINDDKKKVEKRLLESDQYIGIVNVQIQDIKSIFNSIESYPKTKTELKKTFTFFGKRILGITNSSWSLIRIIDSKTQRTISEHFESKGGLVPDFPHVSNKSILEKQQIPSHTAVISEPKNLDILVFCILSTDKISNNEHIFVQAIINEITKLFVIINSTYNNEVNLIFVDGEPERIENHSEQNVLTER
jgi:hypothetical protein